MAEGQPRVGSGGNCMPQGSELLIVGPILQKDALALRVPIPANMGAVRVKGCTSFLTVVLATANSVHTLKTQHGSDSAVAITGGTFTITSTGTVADEDSCTCVHDGTDIVPAGDFIVIAIDGGASAGEAIYFIEVERCLDS